jgi:integrase
MGMIYKRGKTWWIKYYRNGKYYRESSGSEKKMVAKNFLDQREGEIAQGKIPGIHFDKVRLDELAEDLLTDYRINRRKSLERAEISTKHLMGFFGTDRVCEITTTKIKNYIEFRLDEDASNATINRKLAALKRMLNLGAQSKPPKVDRVPHIPMLKEHNVRRGFFGYREFLMLRDALPTYLQGFVTFAFKTGSRKSEIVNLEWSQVDFEIGVVRLEPGMTKNDQGRTVYLDDELMEVLKLQWNLRKRNGKLTPCVFPNESGDGRIKDFRSGWNTACRNLGVGKRLFHDLRRTAVRDMVRAGIPERVAMMISGHQTRSVFERYNIVRDDDLKLAAMRREEYHRAQMGTISGTIAHLKKKKRSGTLA